MLVDEIRSSMKEDAGLDYEDDVKPALGDEVDLVWLDFENGGENAVALTKPKDEDAFRELIAKRKPGGLHIGARRADLREARRLVRLLGHTGEDRALPRSPREIPSLADDEVFNDALAELPEDALVHAYVRGQSVVEALKDLDVRGSA